MGDCLFCKLRENPQKVPWYVKVFGIRHSVEQRCTDPGRLLWRHLVYYYSFFGKMYMEEAY